MGTAGFMHASARPSPIEEEGGDTWAAQEVSAKALGAAAATPPNWVPACAGTTNSEARRTEVRQLAARTGVRQALRSAVPDPLGPR